MKADAKSDCKAMTMKPSELNGEIADARLLE